MSKFGILLSVRNFLTTGDIARASDFSPQQIRNKWNKEQLCAELELVNPGGKQLRFRKTAEIDDWCKKRAAEHAKRRDDRPRRGWSWTQEHERILNRYRPTPYRKRIPLLDETAKMMWRKIAEKKGFSPHELALSIKFGRKTRIKHDHTHDTSAGIATWDALKLDFDIMKRQLGEKWKEWTAEEKKEVLKYLDPFVEFATRLRSEGNDLT